MHWSVSLTVFVQFMSAIKIWLFKMLTVYFGWKTGQQSKCDIPRYYFSLQKATTVQALCISQCLYWLAPCEASWGMYSLYQNFMTWYGCIDIFCKPLVVSFSSGLCTSSMLTMAFLEYIYIFTENRRTRDRRHHQILQWSFCSFNQVFLAERGLKCFSCSSKPSPCCWGKGPRRWWDSCHMFWDDFATEHEESFLFRIENQYSICLSDLGERKIQSCKFILLHLLGSPVVPFPHM